MLHHQQKRVQRERTLHVFLRYLIRAMSASWLKSVAAGRESQPVSGGARPHTFLKRIMSKVMSKSLDDTEERIAGRSFPHCVALMTLRDLRDCNVG